MEQNALLDKSFKPSLYKLIFTNSSLAFMSLTLAGHPPPLGYHFLLEQDFESLAPKMLPYQFVAVSILFATLFYYVLKSNSVVYRLIDGLEKKAPSGAPLFSIFVFFLSTIFSLIVIFAAYYEISGIGAPICQSSISAPSGSIDSQQLSSPIMPTPEESTASYCEGTPVTYPPESPVPVVHGAWTAVYFSTTTWMTVGYGDFVPATGQTQLIAMIEMIFGQIFNAILVGGTIILLIQRLA